MCSIIMQCRKCEKQKLSKEFPSFTLNKDCDHAPLHCFRCVTAHAESFTGGTAPTCSYAQCGKVMDRSKLTLCYIELDALFPEVHPSLGDPSAVIATDKEDVSGNIIIKRLDGMTTTITYDGSLSIRQLKSKIQEQPLKMKVEIDKQSLFFKSKELKDFREGKALSVADCGIRAGDTIHLMILLYAIPPDLKKVVFDISYGWPDAGRDYLDASALFFSTKEYKGVADYMTLRFDGKAVWHSGDRQDRVKKQGKHLIRVDLATLRKDITHIFFTLSSYKSETISHFKTPTLRFFDDSKPDKMLCPDQIKKAGNSQAIVMCSLIKQDDMWFVHDNGATSNGNVKDYEPLKKTIVTIMDSTV